MFFSGAAIPTLNLCVQICMGGFMLENPGYYKQLRDEPAQPHQQQSISLAEALDNLGFGIWH
jgi:hypothetical protein